MRGLNGFLKKHRFRLGDIQQHRQTTSQDIGHSMLFNGTETFSFTLQREELKKLGFAMAAAGHMANSDTDDALLFSQIISLLNEDQWKYCLKFSPFHSVNAHCKP